MESDRQINIMNKLKELLGSQILQKTLSNKTSNDGVITETWHTDLKALLVIIEIKNEMGSRGEPLWQASASYRKWVVAPEVSKIENNNNNQGEDG